MRKIRKNLDKTDNVVLSSGSDGATLTMKNSEKLTKRMNKQLRKMEREAKKPSAQPVMFKRGRIAGLSVDDESKEAPNE